LSGERDALVQQYRQICAVQVRYKAHPPFPPQAIFDPQRCVCVLSPRDLEQRAFAASLPQPLRHCPEQPIQNNPPPPLTFLLHAPFLSASLPLCDLPTKDSEFHPSTIFFGHVPASRRSRTLPMISGSRNICIGSRQRQHGIDATLLTVENSVSPRKNVFL